MENPCPNRTKMKRLILFTIAIILSENANAQSVGISGTAIVPNAYSILEIESKTSGVLLPRLNAGERATLTSTGIGTLEQGLTIYNTDTDHYNYWDGTHWISMGSSTGSYIHNQNAVLQPADYRIAGLGVASQIGVGTGLGPVIGLVHVKDNSPTAGSRLLKVEDYIGNPLITVVDGGQVGLGITAPSPSAILDLTSTNKGFLPPRMTTVQRTTSITTPVQGMIVYQTNSPDEGLWYYDGFSWKYIGSMISSYTLLEDEDADSKVEVEQSTDEDIIRFTAGGTEYLDMSIGRLNVTNTGGSVFLGEGAGANDDLSSNDNVAVGSNALQTNSTGYANTALGNGAGQLITTRYQNTFIGAGADDGTANFNTTAVGYSATTSANNEAVIGNATVTSIGGYAAWSNLSDGRCKQNIESDVPGLEFINKLNPVTYNMNLDALAKIKGTPDSLRSKKDVQVKEQIVYTGLIAQEVEQAAIDLDYDFSGVDAPQNENDHYAIRYAEFVAPLI
ncbi:MAG: hypothetical protein ACI9FU_000158 [Granulosicoccus sp.]|jgi:hypothetical protein